MLQKLLSRMDAYGVQMAEFKQELVDMRQCPQSSIQTPLQKVAGSSSEEDSMELLAPLAGDMADSA